VIPESEHLRIVQEIKVFFKSHLDKLKLIIAKKQKQEKKKDDFIFSLQKKLQSLSIELDNCKVQYAQQSSLLSNLQQEYQQLKVNDLVVKDEINNYVRETGNS
jgi:hypothetical protein